MGADMTIEDVCIRHDPTSDFWEALKTALINKIKKESISASQLKVNTKVITDAIEILENNPRDVTWIRLPDSNGSMITIYLTGGMSYGDSPTDSLDIFHDLYELFPEYRYIDEVLDE